MHGGGQRFEPAAVHQLIYACLQGCRDPAKPAERREMGQAGAHGLKMQLAAALVLMHPPLSLEMRARSVPELSEIRLVLPHKLAVARPQLAGVGHWRREAEPLEAVA